MLQLAIFQEINVLFFCSKFLCFWYIVYRFAYLGG